MKIVKSANGKTSIKMARSEWEEYGKKAGWLKQANEHTDECDKCGTCQKCCEELCKICKECCDC